MGLSVDITEDDVFQLTGDFIASILDMPSAMVQQGQVNRVSEPSENDFVLLIPLRRRRIETNVDSFQDDAWVGGIAGTILTVTELLSGAVRRNAEPTANVALTANTAVGTQISGTPGGTGTYNIAPGQTVAGGTIFQAGYGAYLQPTEFTIQVEVHGPNSSDNAQIIATMTRDDFAYDFFTTRNANITPLLADDPKQMPFNNDQQQVENRWILEFLVQANITVQAPQQFADEVVVVLKNVDVEFPPS